MGMMYAWASPEYLLNKMSIEEIARYYEHGLAILNNKPSGPNKDKPNKKKFRNTYGDRIKTPEDKEGEVD